MISFACDFSEGLKNFLDVSNVPVDKVSENFGKQLWMIQNLNADGKVIGALCYSFMYSTWTRYNPFISLCIGENIDEMVKFLSKKFPGALIRGCVNSSEDPSVYVF